MVGACGSEQQRLHLRPEGLGSTRQDDVPYRLRTRRAAGLARHRDLVALVAQLMRQPADLRRLARALAAFERDEKAARQILKSVSRRRIKTADDSI